MTDDMTLLDCSVGEIWKVTAFCEQVISFVGNFTGDISNDCLQVLIQQKLMMRRLSFQPDPQSFSFEVRLSRNTCHFHQVADDLEHVIYMIHLLDWSKLVFLLG